MTNEVFGMDGFDPAAASSRSRMSALRAIPLTEEERTQVAESLSAADELSTGPS